jgi:hypothetical protein
MATEEIVLNNQKILTLKELLRPGLRAIFVGLNPTNTSVDKGHYYQGALGRQFWKRLFEHRIVSELTPGEEDDEAFALGFGFADLVRRPTAAAEALTANEKLAAVSDLPARLSATGEHRQAPYSAETAFERWILAVLQARSFQELQSDTLRVRGKRIGLSPAEINRDMRSVRGGYAQMFQFMQAKAPGAAEFTAKTWGESILKGMGKPVTEPNSAVIVQRLNAAYGFQARQWKFITNPQYDFGKHDSDFTDCMQLCYLCDPELYFVTTDRHLLNSAHESTQGAQVLDFSELQRRLR